MADPAAIAELKVKRVTDYDDVVRDYRKRASSAPIGADRNEMPLSVLSALARLNLDPWKEAAELSELPKDTATQRLIALIARLPGGRWAKSDLGAIADRLIELLPYRASSKVQSVDQTHRLRGMTGSAVPIMLICALLVTALIIALRYEPSSRGDDAYAPATTSAPQTSSPTSRR